MVSLTIDSTPVAAPDGTTILEAARQVGINIPTLCYLKDVQAIGACREVLESSGTRTDSQFSVRSRQIPLTPARRSATLSMWYCRRALRLSWNSIRQTFEQ